MKKTAVLLYDSFCNFEISPALEILALAEKPITIFGISKQAIRSEDGLSVIPDATIDNFDLDAYDSLILPGAMDIREAIENKKIIDFITPAPLTRNSSAAAGVRRRPIPSAKPDYLMENRSWLVSIKKRFLKKDFPKVI